MAGMMKRQGTSAAPRVPESQGWLVLTTAPAGARGLLGQALTDCGAITVPGLYECEIITEGWAAVWAAVQVSAETGAVVPTLVTKWLADQSVRDTTGATAFTAATPQLLTLANLNGQRKAFLRFTIAGGESLTFNRAEFNGK